MTGYSSTYHALSCQFYFLLFFIDRDNNLTLIIKISFLLKYLFIYKITIAIIQMITILIVLINLSNLLSYDMLFQIIFPFNSTLLILLQTMIIFNIWSLEFMLMHGYCYNISKPQSRLKGYIKINGIKYA